MVSTSRHKAGVATLLHLSDLHFGTPEAKGHFWNSEGSDPEVPAHDQRRLLGRLVADLERQPTPDIVVVSGDLLDKADAAGVPMVQAFLAELAAKLGLARTRFVLVPGNHDVIRGASGAEAYQHFDAIWQAFYGDERLPLEGKAVQERVQVFDCPELELQLVGFNSCEILEQGHEEGYVGETQRERAEEAMKAIQGARFRVAVMHHHLETPEGTRTRDVSVMVDGPGVRHWLIDHGFSLVLHGHQHLDWQRVGGLGREPEPDEWKLAVVAAASLGVGTYGRKTWRLPLGYQVLCLETHTSGKRIRREYSERHGRFGKASHESRERPEQALRFGSPRVSSRPRRDMREFLPDFDALLEVLLDAHKPKLLEHRTKAERNQMVDIVGLADDLLDGSPAYQGESRTKFAVRARWLITRLALAVPVSPSGALAAELVEPHGRIASAPPTTHLLVAILMAQGQGSRAVLLHYDNDKHFVRGQSEVPSSVLACCPTAADAIEAFEGVLWDKLLKYHPGDWQPRCKLVPDGHEGPPSSTPLGDSSGQELVTFEQCLERRRLRNRKSKCNQDCPRWRLYHDLVKLCRGRKRPFVVLEEEDAEPWRTVAERVRDVSFICFGEGDDTAEAIEEPLAMAIDGLFEELQGA